MEEIISYNQAVDYLLCLDSKSLLSELQDTSSVESVEIEFVPDFEEHLESNKFSPTDVFSAQLDYELFLLNQEIDTPSDNPNHQDTHVSESKVQMTSSFMPLTLATTLHYPNSWHNTTVKT